MTMHTNQLRTRHLRRAFTLIELLVAMALTLILVYAIAEFYAYVGSAVRDSRAMIELGGQLRAAGKKLHNDLDSLTLRPEPWIDAYASPGYFSVYEGPCSDMRPDNGVSDITLYSGGDAQVPDLVEVGNTTTLVGDGDDILAMTIRSPGLPFEAQVWNGTAFVRVTSPFAEVIWYTTFVDTDGSGLWNIGEPRFLCRRQLIIAPSLGTLAMPNNPATGSPMTIADFKQTSEVSFRVNTAGQAIANSMADLALRHNRFGCWIHADNGFSDANYAPLQMNPTTVDTSNAGNITLFSLHGDKFGEDRVLSNLLAFDVRVWDPNAPIYADADSVAALIPGDVGYEAASSGTVIGYGAWVDLWYRRGTGVTVTSHFSNAPSVPRTSGAAFAQNYAFARWDTWPSVYEVFGNGTDGRSQNGLDDPDIVDNVTRDGVDSAGERQTQPPYAAPLRGVQVKLRVYEPQTRQARQVTIASDFIAE
jgi:prepilin-type N-terminal cleavage/methylation domain-containing protein